MKGISAVVIAKDEEEMIADCLDSLSFAQEIIVVDNGSKDRTKEIAEKMNAHVLLCESDDFSVLRNFGRDRVTYNWILYIDADERVSSALRDSIKYQVSSIKYEFSAYRIKRKNFYLGGNEWPYIERLERLFQKDKLKTWQGKLHESPVVEGKIGELDGFLLHFTHRNLAQMLDKTIEWSKIEAEARFNTHHPKMSWWRFPRVMTSTFLDYYVKQGGYKLGSAGLIESLYQSFSIFITYARLWEMQQGKK